MELLQTFEYENLKVELFFNGTRNLPNKTYIDGELVYEDETFKPSPLYDIDAPEAIVSLLGFFTLRKGDADEEFFSDRPDDKLLNWATEDEEVRLMIYDYEERENESFLEENEMTYEECTRIEKFIKQW